MMRPAKRRWALLESNPPRNNRLELIAWPDGKFQGFSSGTLESHAIDSMMPWKTHGRRGGGRWHQRRRDERYLNAGVERLPLDFEHGC
jgi:hypothetical protein